MLGKLLCKFGVHVCIQAMSYNPDNYGCGYVLVMVVVIKDSGIFNG